MSTSAVAFIENPFFRRGYGLNEEPIAEGLDNIPVIHRSTKQIYVGKLKEEVGDSMHYSV